MLAVSASLIAMRSPSRTSGSRGLPELSPSCRGRGYAAFLVVSHSVMGDHRDWQGGPEAERRGMTPAAIVIVIIFLAAGLTLGWHGQKSVAAHSDVKVGHARVKGGRRTRWRSGVVA